MGGINEKNPPSPLLSLVQAGQQLFMKELKLQLHICSPGHRGGLAKLQAQADHDPPGLGVGEPDAADLLDSGSTFT